MSPGKAQPESCIGVFTDPDGIDQFGQKGFETGRYQLRKWFQICFQFASQGIIPVYWDRQLANNMLIMLIRTAIFFTSTYFIYDAEWSSGSSPGKCGNFPGTDIVRWKSGVWYFHGNHCHRSAGLLSCWFPWQKTLPVYGCDSC